MEGFPSPESAPFGIQHSLVSPVETQQCQRYRHSTDQEQSCSLGRLLGGAQCCVPPRGSQTCRQQLLGVTLLIAVLTLYLQLTVSDLFLYIKYLRMHQSAPKVSITKITIFL